MERMRIELEAEGRPVHFVAINDATAQDDQAKLVERCSFPLLQDLPDVDAWGLMGGRKDDFFVFTAEGALSAYLPQSHEPRPVLSDEEGYATLKAAVLQALSRSPSP